MFVDDGVIDGWRTRPSPSCEFGDVFDSSIFLYGYCVHLWSSEPGGGADIGVDMTAMLLLLLHVWRVTTNARPGTGGSRAAYYAA